MNLEELNLVGLDYHDILTIEGGGGIGWAWLADQVVENWDEIKKGFRDGFAAAY